MRQAFYWDSYVGDFLFPGLSVNSIGGLVGVCLSAGSLSFLFECIRYLQAKQRQKQLLLRSRQLRTICPTESSSLLSSQIASPDPRNPLNITVVQRFIIHTTDIGLWFLLLNMGYLLMLIIMVYNGWIFVAAIIGGGIGYFVFGQLFMKITLENCQILRETYCKTPGCGDPGDSPSQLRDGCFASTSKLGCHYHNAEVHAVKVSCIMDNQSLRL